MPYLSGGTRMVVKETLWAGGESNLPCRKDGWFTASCALWRDRPMSKPGGAGLDDDVSAVVKELVAGLGARRGSRLGRCRTPGRRCWRPRRPPWLEPKGSARMTCARDAEKR